MPKNSKLGLVLSGGGAKGAYEAGVIKALAKLKIEPSVITGASIGAVNGSVVASSIDMETAAEDLELVWTGLDKSTVLKPNFPVKRLAAIAGMHIFLQSFNVLCPEFRIISLLGIPGIKSIFSDEDKKVIHLLDQSPLEDILKKTVRFDELSEDTGKDFFVAVFPAGKSSKSPELFKSMCKYVLSSGKSDFFRVNGRPQEEAVRVVLASAAVPIGFKPVKVGGQWYYDGGMGERIKAQGNTPVSPIVESGCTHAIVVMLDNGVMWDRYEWPDLTVAEIRPSIDMGGIEAMFDFSPDKIKELMAIGENDAMNQLGRIYDSLTRVAAAKKSAQKLSDRIDGLIDHEKGYKASMLNIDSIFEGTSDFLPKKM